MQSQRERGWKDCKVRPVFVAVALVGAVSTVMYLYVTSVDVQGHSINLHRHIAKKAWTNPKDIDISKLPYCIDTNGRIQSLQTPSHLIPSDSDKTSEAISGKISPTGITGNPCDQANITLVSAFFDIGTHKKGTSTIRSMEQYYEWSKAWRLIVNRLVLYTDSKDFAAHMTKVRSALDPSLTHIYLIKRESLWPFNLRDEIARLYSSPDYPKHHPNTVVPEYSCIQHSKYALLADTILKRREIPASRVYAWVDVAYFRIDAEQKYCLRLPDNFRENEVSFNQVFSPRFFFKMKTIFYENHVWVGGGMFVAARDTMLVMCNEYHRAVEYLLFKRNFSSTDQQVLYAAFSDEGRPLIDFGVKLNVKPGDNDWFDLGMSSLHKLE